MPSGYLILPRSNSAVEGAGEGGKSVRWNSIMYKARVEAMYIANFRAPSPLQKKSFKKEV